MKQRSQGQSPTQAPNQFLFSSQKKGDKTNHDRQTAEQKNRQAHQRCLADLTPPTWQKPHVEIEKAVRVMAASTPRRRKIMRIQQLNIECLRLINLAGGREVPIDDFHFMPLQAAQLTLKYNGNDEHAIKQHIETLRASLTAANVAECVECKPLFMYEISARKGQPRYRVIMELLDEANDRALRDVAFCRVPVETGNHGYKVTGLFKEAGIVPVAIIEKI